MVDKLNGDLLRLARQYRGFDQKELAASLNVDAATISRAENGVVEPTKATIQLASEKLGFPVEFFYLSDRVFGLPLSSHPMWRKRKSVTQRDRDQALAEFNLRILHLRRLLRSLEFAPKLPLPRYEVDDYQGDIEAIAAAIRLAWQVPRGPIQDLTAVAESAGIIVFNIDSEQSDIDGATIQVPDLPPCVFLNKNMPADRMRFSLAHEIGHIVMHRFPSEDMEVEANKFAAALLVPRNDVHNDFAARRIDLQRLAQLKPIWKVAMQSLLMRATELGYLDKSRAPYIWRQFNYHRYKTREPAELDFPRERPVLVQRLFDLHSNDLGYTPSELAKALFARFADLSALYGLSEPQQRSVLRLVT